MAKARRPWAPRAHDFQLVFSEQNPWHSSGTVPTVLALERERPLAAMLWRRLLDDEPRRFQLVLGPRRVGKTTVMYQTVRRLLQHGIGPRRLWWLRLDHPLLMPVGAGQLVRSILAESKATLDAPAFLFLDEITYGQDWDRWLKTFFDERWPIRLAGTSSATAAISQARHESGVGRWDEQRLTPYLFTEYLDLVGQRPRLPLEDNFVDTIRACIDARVPLAGLDVHRRRFILTGGFPELLTGYKDRPPDDASLLLQSQRTLRNDAVVKAVYQDIPQAFRIDDPLLLERVLYTLAGQFTGLLSPTSLCQELGGLSQPTLDKYISYLERAYLVFTLPNYSGNESSVQKRGRKLYFVDGAIRNAALQRGLLPLSDNHEMGLLTENLIAGHLHALGLQDQTRVYHWREGQDEVDLIYDHPRRRAAFEITTSARHSRRGIYAFMAKYPRFKGRCYIVSPMELAQRPEDSDDQVGSLPLDLLLLAAGASAERALRERLEPMPPAPGAGGAFPNGGDGC